jgi:hypothetical protein
MEKSYNFKMQMGWCSVLSWAATLSLALKPQRKIDWMVIPFGAIVFTIIHFKMSMLISEYKDKSKTSHGSYRTTNTSRLLSRAENDNRYSRQLLHLPDEKKT